MRRSFEEAPYVDRALERAPDEYRLRLTLRGTRRKFRAEEAYAERAVARTLGLGTPDGFVEAPLVLTKRYRDSPREVRFAERFNQEHVRREGDGVLRPDEPYLFRLPVAYPERGFGWLNLRCEAKLGAGGRVLLSAPLGDAEPGAVTRYLEYWRKFRGLRDPG